jgi:trigger factor
VEVTVDKSEPCLAKISFTVPSDEYEGEVKRLLKQLGRQVRMKGFRPGKVPAAVVERTHGKQAREEAKSQLLQRVWQQAIEEHELKPLNNPHAHFEDEVLVGQNFEGDFEVDLRPEFELGTYTGLTASTTLDPVSDEEVEGAIEQAARGNARPEPAGEEGLPEDGMALCKVELLFQDEVVFTREGMRMGPGHPVPGVDPEEFKTALTGAVDEAVIELPTTFPSDFEKEEARDQEGLCRITVAQAFKIVVPTREELVAQLDGVEDEDRLLAKARESLEEARLQELTRRREAELLEQVIEAHEIELPPSMVEDQIKGRLETMRRELEGAGTPEAKVEEELSAQEDEVRRQAIRGAKAYFLVEAIAEKENLQVTREELQAELASIAERNQATLEEVSKYYQEQNLFPQLALEVVERKVRRFLLESAAGASPDGPGGNEEPAEA